MGPLQYWLAGLVLLIDPPASQRLVGLSPLLCVLVALGLDRLLALAHNSWSWEVTRTDTAATTKPVDYAVLLLVLAGMLLGSIRFYFGQYTPGGFFLEANSELLDRAGRYLRNLGPEYYVYFAGAPRVYWGAPTIAFLAPGMQGQDVLEPVSVMPVRGGAVGKAVFLFTPERASELNWLRVRYPGGRVQKFRSSGHELLFLSYELS